MTQVNYTSAYTQNLSEVISVKLKSPLSRANATDYLDIQERLMHTKTPLDCTIPILSCFCDRDRHS